MIVRLVQYTIGGYMKLLRKYPLPTQAISTGVIMSSGDVLAQTFVEKKPNYDPFRTLKFGSIGLLFVGPIFHNWYHLLDKAIKGKSFVRPMKMVLTDQFVMAPFMVFSIISLVGFTKHWSIEEAKDALSTNYAGALFMNFKLWPTIQFMNFMFVPVYLRVMVVNFVALFWNSYLSYKAQQTTFVE